MKKTLHIDGHLLAEARTVSGAATDTEAVRLGLDARLRHAAYERLRALRGSEPAAEEAPSGANGQHANVEPRSGVGRHRGVDRFLAGRAPQANALDRLLENDEVVGHDLVQGELLMGDTGTRRTLLEAYARIDHARTVPQAEVVEFVRVRRLRGRGIGGRRASPGLGVSGALRALDERTGRPRGLDVTSSASPHDPPVASQLLVDRRQPLDQRRGAADVAHEPVEQPSRRQQVGREGRKRHHQAFAAQQVRARVRGVEAARHLLQRIVRPELEPRLDERREQPRELGARPVIGNRRTEARSCAPSIM